MARKKHICKPFAVCDYCLQEIESRGEKIVKWDTFYSSEYDENTDLICEWCNEEADTLTEIQFR